MDTEKEVLLKAFKEACKYIAENDFYIDNMGMEELFTIYNSKAEDGWKYWAYYFINKVK